MNFLKSKSKTTSATTFLAIITILCTVSLYYLQYDISATNWIYAFSYAILSVSSGISLFYFILNRNTPKLILSIGFFLMNAINLAGSVIYAITLVNHFTIITAAATSVFLIFALSYTDTLALKIHLNKNVFYNIIISVACIIPVVLSFVLKKPAQKNTMLTIMYIEAALIFTASIVLSIMSIIKGNRDSFPQIYMVFSLVLLISNIFNLCSIYKMQNLLHALICLTLAFIVPFLIQSENSMKKKNKSKHK